MAGVVVATVGCGGPKSEEVTPLAEKTPKDEIQTILQGIATTGEAGSAAGALMPEITKLEATDAALAGSLKPDAEALMGISDPAAAKTKAQAMLQKLQ